MTDVSDGEICWPEGFMCIGDRTFAWVYTNRKEFVEFTLEKMDKPTKLFKLWKTYCLKQNRNAQKRISDQAGVRDQEGVREANEETKDEQVDKETKETEWKE